MTGTGQDYESDFMYHIVSTQLEIFYRDRRYGYTGCSMGSALFYGIMEIEWVWPKLSRSGQVNYAIIYRISPLRW